MPSELHFITFSPEEVVEAVLAFCQATSRSVPAEPRKRIILPSPTETTYTLELESDSPDVTFQESEIAAALLAYCKKVRIPVARKATKSLEVRGNLLVLRLALGGA